MNAFDNPYLFFVDDQCPSFQPRESFDYFQRIVELHDIGCDARTSYTNYSINVCEKSDKNGPCNQHQSAPFAKPDAFDRCDGQAQHDEPNVIEQASERKSRKEENCVLGNAKLRQHGDRGRVTNSDHRRGAREQPTTAPAGLNVGGQTDRQNEFSRNNLRSEENKRAKCRESTRTGRGKSMQSCSQEFSSNSSESDEARDSEVETNENQKLLYPDLREFVDRAVDRDSLLSIRGDKSSNSLKNNAEFLNKGRVPVFYMQNVVKPRLESFGSERTKKFRRNEALSLKPDRTQHDKAKANRTMSSRINGRYEGEYSSKGRFFSKYAESGRMDNSKESLAWRNSLRNNIVFNEDDRSELRNDGSAHGKVRKLPVRSNVIDNASKSKKLNDSSERVIQDSSESLRRFGKSSTFCSKLKEESKLSISSWNRTRTNMAAERRKIFIRKKWIETDKQKVEADHARTVEAKKKDKLKTTSDEKQSTVFSQVSKNSCLPVRTSKRKWSKMPSAVFSRQSKVPEDDQSEISRRSRTKPVSKNAPEQNSVKEHLMQEDSKPDSFATENLVQVNVSNAALSGKPCIQQNSNETTQHDRGSSEFLQGKRSFTSGNLHTEQLCTEEPMICEPIEVPSDVHGMRQESYSKWDVDKSTRERTMANGVSYRVLNMVNACREQRKRNFVMHGFECEKRRRTNESEEVLDIGISVVEHVFSL